MESYIILHNHFYPSSDFLIRHTQSLCNKIGVKVAGIKQIILEDRFLPFINPISYYSSLVMSLDAIFKNQQKLLVCDTQSLLVLINLFQKLYKHSDFKEAVSQACNGVDLSRLEDCFVFAPELFLGSMDIAGIKRGRWEGFTCAIIFDRELEHRVKESQILLRIESITGLKILPFFKESYAYLLQSYPKLAYKMGAMDYYEMVDCGVDCIVVSNVGNFELMDRQTKALRNVAGRDIAEIPLLFFPQVLLALFSDANAESLGFSAHNIKPQMF